jgi:hypothetical protein
MVSIHICAKLMRKTACFTVRKRDSLTNNVMEPQASTGTLANGGRSLLAAFFVCGHRGRAGQECPASFGVYLLDGVGNRMEAQRS